MASVTNPVAPRREAQITDDLDKVRMRLRLTMAETRGDLNHSHIRVLAAVLFVLGLVDIAALALWIFR